MTGFYHVCFVVPDLERAMRDFTRVSGTAWGTPQDRTLGEWPYRIVFTSGPPYVELIEGSPGSPWDPGDGARFDHLGWWSQSVEDDSRRLVAEGLPEDFNGCPYGRPFVYHKVDSIGARFELVDASLQRFFLDTWNPGGPPMPSLGQA